MGVQIISEYSKFSSNLRVETGPRIDFSKVGGVFFPKLQRTHSLQFTEARISRRSIVVDACFS